MKHSIHVAIAAGALLATASAFVLLSPPRKWHTNQLPRNFTICMQTGENSLAASYVQAACQAGVSVWNTAIGSTKFTTNVSTTTGNVGFVNNGVSTISFEDPQNALATGVLAATTTGWYTTGVTETTNGTTFNRFTDSDLVFNNNVDFTSFGDADQFGANGSQYDMESVAVHEVGHAIGLDHSAVGEQVTMYASIGAQDYRKRTLDDDDVNGAKHCYASGSVTYAAGAQLICDSTFLGLSTPTFKNNSLVYVRIAIVDENGNSVANASVSVSITRPDGTVGVGTATTNAAGMVTFNSGKAQKGAYATTVTGVTRAGMTFNAGSGKSADTCTF